MSPFQVVAIILLSIVIDAQYPLGLFRQGRQFDTEASSGSIPDENDNYDFK